MTVQLATAEVFLTAFKSLPRRQPKVVVLRLANAAGRITRMVRAKSGTPDEFVYWGDCRTPSISTLPCSCRK